MPITPKRGQNSTPKHIEGVVQDGFHWLTHGGWRRNGFFSTTSRNLPTALGPDARYI